MKARRLSEVRQLVGSPELKGWWESLLQVRQAHQKAAERYDDLLGQAMLVDFRAELAQKNAIDTLYRAGELEDSAAKMAAEVQQLDNASFKTVADFEEQRIRACEVWYRACAAEKQAESLREKHEAIERRAGSEGAPTAKKDQEAERGRIEVELKRVERSFTLLQQENERELAIKNRLWDEVERIWARSMELALLVAERRAQSAKVRSQAEVLFAQAEERKRRSRELRAEAEVAAREREAFDGKLAEALNDARARFGCAHGDEYLYFRQKESPRRAWCVALSEDDQHYNIEVKPLAIYSIDQRRGVAFLEPAVEASGSDEEGDRRFESYFLQGRKGRVREEPPERQSA